MSDINKPIFPADFTMPKIEVPSVEEMRAKAQRKLENPQPEIEKAKGFIERNQKVIVGGIVVIVVLKVNKRKVAKATAKQVLKTLEKAGQQQAAVQGTARTAAALMVDDWFNVGGKMYRIGSKVFNDFGEPVIKLYTPGDLDNYVLMVAGPKTVIETFNQ